MKKIFLFFFAAFAFFAQAQNKNILPYALNIGNFANAELVDFVALQRYGLVYAVPMANNQAQIFVGDFGEKATAEAALKNIKKAYPEAYLAQKKATASEVPTIQIASRKVGETINWKTFGSAGNIFAISDGKITRILSAGFPNDSIAKLALAKLRKIGYKDAILKNYNEINVHKISFFEAGLALDSALELEQEKKATPPPTPVIAPPAPPVIVEKYQGNYPITELKRGLSMLGFYKGKIDEKPDATLSKAFEEAKKNDNTLKKYATLAVAYKAEKSKTSDLQVAINMLPYDTEKSIKTLEKSTQPIAKAYRAYHLFTQNGDGNTINKLMNEALQTAFKGAPKHDFNVDIAATYDYKDLALLIKHIRFIQGVTKDEPAAPAWLFLEHTKEAKEFFTGSFKIEPIDPAMNLDAVKMTKLMADDLMPKTTKNAKQDIIDAENRTRMMLAPTSVIENQDDWNKNLWEGLDAWATKDALNDKNIKAFRVVYYEAVQQLQRYYGREMGLKTSAENDNLTKNAALLTMKSIVDDAIAQYGRQPKK
jgi:hypothetical protein